MMSSPSRALHSECMRPLLRSRGLPSRAVTTCPMPARWLQRPQKPPPRKAWWASQEHPLSFTKERKDWIVFLDPSNLQEESNARFQPQLSWDENEGASLWCWAAFCGCRAKGWRLGKERVWNVWNEDQRQEGMPVHRGCTQLSDATLLLLWFERAIAVRRVSVGLLSSPELKVKGQCLGKLSGH